MSQSLDQGPSDYVPESFSKGSDNWNKYFHRMVAAFGTKMEMPIKDLQTAMYESSDKKSPFEIGRIRRAMIEFRMHGLLSENEAGVYTRLFNIP